MPQYRYYEYTEGVPTPGPQNQDGSPVLMRCLVPPEDKSKYVIYEVRFETPARLISPNLQEDGHGSNHLYYVISGTGKVTLDEGETATSKERSKETHEWNYSDDCLIALPPSARANLDPSSPTRLMIVHVDTDPELPLPPPSFYTLQEIIGTDKDVDYSGGKGHGRSRRFVNKAEGFNCTVTLTSVMKDVDLSLQYTRHYESAYIISGKGTYTWNDGKDEAVFDQESRGPDALMVNHNAHESHRFQSFSDNTRIICVFYPPLQGQEKHDTSKQSSY